MVMLPCRAVELEGGGPAVVVADLDEAGIGQRAGPLMRVIPSLAVVLLVSMLTVPESPLLPLRMSVPGRSCESVRALQWCRNGNRVRDTIDGDAVEAVSSVSEQPALAERKRFINGHSCRRIAACRWCVKNSK